MHQILGEILNKDEITASGSVINFPKKGNQLDLYKRVRVKHQKIVVVDMQVCLPFLCKIFQKTFFTEHLQANTSEYR